MLQVRTQIIKMASHVKICFFIGLVFTFISFLPYLILKENAYFLIRDQLDGEVLAYMLSAKHLFSTHIPEFMNGALSSALTPASPGTVLLYLIISPFWAFLSNHFFVLIIAYIGMFLCLQELLNRPWISCGVSFLFALLPFYSVYGLSVMGQPLLLYGFICLYKQKNTRLAIASIIIFTCFSSLVLVGYVDIILAGGFTLYFIFKRNAVYKKFCIAASLMVILYILFNISLIRDFLFSQTFVSHKSEVVASSSAFQQTFLDLFQNGFYHAASLHTSILNWAKPAIIILLLVYSFLSKPYQQYVLGLLGLFSFALFAAAAYALWSYTPIVHFRNDMGGIFVSFQPNRIYWLYPCVWYLIFGFILFFIHIPMQQSTKLFSKIAGSVLISFLFISSGYNIYDNNEMLKTNVERLFQKESETLLASTSWDAFYSPELFSKIKDYIDKPLSDYRVVSIGIHPAVALYNGFYCLDGYSNNYSIEYKHEFRTIIENELKKDKGLMDYYDHWGNRCYIIAREYPYEFELDKHSDKVMKEINLNTGKLKEMGCQYLFSAIPIQSPYMTGIEPYQDFTSENSPYHIYVYKIRF